MNMNLENYAEQIKRISNRLYTTATIPMDGYEKDFDSGIQDLKQLIEKYEAEKSAPPAEPISVKTAIEKYFASNVFTDDVSHLDIQKRNISDDKEAQDFIYKLKDEGYKVKYKSYSDFTAIMGVKLK